MYWGDDKCPITWEGDVIFVVECAGVDTDDPFSKIGVALVAQLPLWGCGAGGGGGSPIFSSEIFNY